MKASGLFALLLFAASAAHADRFVMKDNSVRVGTLTGMHDGYFSANVGGITEQIPVSIVSMVILEDSSRQVRGQGANSVPAPVANGRGLGTNAAALDPIAPISSPTSQTVGGLRVDLERCTKQGSKSVVCNFRLTNLQPDRLVAVTATAYGQASFYIDDQGMQRLAESVTLGTSQGGFTTAVTDVRIRGSLTFPGVESGVNSLAKLSIWINLPDYVHYTAEFRNIPLQGN